MNVLAIDPDTHATSWAMVNSRNEVTLVGCASTPRSLTGEAAVRAMAHELHKHFYPVVIYQEIPFDLAIVEGQEAYRPSAMSKRIDYNNLLPLAQVTGQVVMALEIGMALAKSDAVLRIPKPREWKGQVPKRVHQARTYEALKLPYSRSGGKSDSDGYCVPEIHDWPYKPSGWEQIKRSEWKHVSDAIAMARWGLTL